SARAAARPRYAREGWREARDGEAPRTDPETETQCALCRLELFGALRRGRGGACAGRRARPCSRARAGWRARAGRRARAKGDPGVSGALLEEPGDGDRTGLADLVPRAALGAARLGGR